MKSFGDLDFERQLGPCLPSNGLRGLTALLPTGRPRIVLVRKGEIDVLVEQFLQRSDRLKSPSASHLTHFRVKTHVLIDQDRIPIGIRQHEGGSRVILSFAPLGSITVRLVLTQQSRQ